MNGYYAIASIIIALILTGPSDYQDAVLMHKTLCEQSPKPVFCKDEIK